MDYEFIVELKETFEINYANKLMSEGWVLLSAAPMLNSGTKYSFGWDKRNGEVPKENHDNDPMLKFMSVH